MKRILPIFSIGIFIVLMGCFPLTALYGQTTVFSDDFSVSAGTNYTTAPGPVGNSAKWDLTRSGADFGAKINDGYQTLTNDAGGTANTSGWVMSGANTGDFATPYSQILGNNPGMVTWTFNMRQIATNPGGFAATAKGVAYILAGTAGTTNVSGTGYAIVLGNSGSKDPIKLVRYTSGLRTAITMITSSTSGLADFGNQHLSVKVTYTPSTHTWQLYLRNDGSAFQDPAIGTLTSQGTNVNNTYTASVLPIMGLFWNVTYGFIGSSNQTAFFDNVKVTVAVPTITSISPTSKVAGTGGFTLTVNGTNFVNGVSVIHWEGNPIGTTFISSTQLTAAIPASNLITSGTAAITVVNLNAESNTQLFTIDAAGVPSLTVSTNSLAGVTTTTGTASPSQTYTISGANLTVDPVITPPANFELSTNGTNYFNSLTLPRSGNLLTGQPVTIYSRLRSAALPGNYSGTIANTVSGGITKNITASGVVLSLQPTTQSSGVTFSNVTSASFTVNWTGGNGTNRLVLIRAAGAVNAGPVDGVTYSPKTTFGTGAEIGTGNFVVYNSTGNAVTITGLLPTTAYHVAVYNFNGSGGTENYLNTASAIGNRTTLNAPIGWQIYATNTVNTINFDTTVDGVNADEFQADGLAPDSESGGLNSNAWAIAGFTDGAIDFGGTSTEDQDFDRGVSEAGVSEGGIYAFETTPNNFALGIQPATGDFAPGTVTLRFQNQTGTPVTSLNIGYKVYIYNDEAGSSSFNFSHSANNTAYTAIPGLNVVSPAAADINPGWKAYYRVVTITGINIANNNYYYLRWSGATVSGSNAFDEFALDDIVLNANPTTNFVPFGDAAESFVLMGNAVLSTNATVSSNLTFNGGKLDFNGRTLAVKGVVTNTIAGGLKPNATGNLLVNGMVSPSLSFDQTTPGTSNALTNLTINTTAGNTTTILNPVVINGILTTDIGQNLNFGTNALTGTLSAINNNGALLTQNATAAPLPVGKTWGGKGTVHYNAASALQTAVAGTYHNLTASSTGGTVAGGAIAVNRIMHLPTPNPTATTSSFATGNFAVTMGGNATNTGIGDINGVVTRNTILPNVIYTFGHEHTSILFPNLGTLPISMSLKIAIGTTPSWRPGAISRSYDFIQSGAADTKAVIKAHYLDSELNGNREAKLVDWVRIVSSNTLLEQGRSNFNTVENWIELSNVNIGLYFKNVFDAVLLTLDESEAGALTWNGSISDSWTTAENWTPNATPSDDTAVFIPNANTTPRDPILNPSVLLGTLTIDEGGILNAPANSQFTLNGAGGAWVNYGTYNPGSGTSRVIFTNPEATIAGNTDFNNVTINTGAGLRAATDNVMRISGALIATGNLLTGASNNTIEYRGTNQVIAIPTGTLPGYHNLIVNGTGAVFPPTLNITGDLTINENVDFSGKTIVMSASTPQIIGGSVIAAFHNLTINNSAGVNLTNSAAANGILSLSNGVLDIGNHIFTLGTAAVSGTFSTTAMIAVQGSGAVRRPFSATGSYTFPIGDITGAVNYSPITVAIASGTFSNAYVGVSVTDARHPNNGSVENNISRYWTVTQTGITGATASINATYQPEDITGNESAIAAAQLNGVFNLQTNPWSRFTNLSANTLNVSSATLTSGIPSYFTGIKGAPFSVLLSGYGSFCKDETVTLLATPTGGDMPYTYAWSGGLASGPTANPSTATVGTSNYSVTVKDNNGITASDNNNVIVLNASVGGNLVSGQSICANTIPGNISLSGFTGEILYWQIDTDPLFSSPTNISNTTLVLTGAMIGNMTQTSYIRAVIKSASCPEVYSTVSTIVIRETTWNGTFWTNGEPNSTTAATITGNYTGTADFVACTLTVTNNAVVNMAAGYDVTLNGKLTVDPGSSVTLQNNASLLQLTPVVNTGNISVIRNTSALLRLDYTMWASPVSGQNMLAFSPLTSVTPISRFYKYNTQTNTLQSIVTPAAETFADAKGYLIRVRNTHSTTMPSIWPGKFTGEPHNGTFNYSMANFGESNGVSFRYNLIGNPYPSPIDAIAFVDDNVANITGKLYFWRKRNETGTPTYSTWVKAPYTIPGTPRGTFVTTYPELAQDPLGVIQTGQGFIVEALENATNVQFNNEQRIANHANQFFRAGNQTTAAQQEYHRLWLNATNAAGDFCQTAVCYFEGASDQLDAIDARAINNGPLELYSFIDSKKLVIQARSLPFSNLDIVPLGFKATTAGTYNIAIDHMDGTFLQQQDVFLKDKLILTTHDLKAGAYTFSTEAGTFEGRFEVVYQAASLGVNDPILENAIVVYKQGEVFVINSGNMTMDEVAVYDIRGRLIVSQKGLNASETTFNAGEANQVLVVKITSDTKQMVTKKVVN